MKKNVLPSIVIIVFSISIIFLFILKPKVSKSFWKDYFVLAVEKDYPTEDIVHFLETASIFDFIFQFSSSQALDPESFPFALSYTDTERLFMDETQRFQLFYIPLTYLHLFTQDSFVKKIPFAFHLDTTLKKNYSLFFLSLVLFFLLLWKTKGKGLFAFTGIFLLISSLFYSQLLFLPLYLSLFYLLFFISLSYKRRHFLQFFRKNIFCILISVFFCISHFLGDFSFFIRSLCISSLCFSALFLYCILEREIDKRRRFSPVLILASTKKTSPQYRSVFTFLPFALACFLFFILSFFNLTIQNKDTIRIPFPLQKTQKESFSIFDYEKAIEDVFCTQNTRQFPHLACFILDSWNLARYPYVSVYDEDFYNREEIAFVKAGETISFSQFLRDDEGNIRKVEKTLYTFDNSFIASILERIQEKRSVEYLLKSQNCFTDIVYEETSKIIAENKLQLKLFFSCVFSVFLILLIFVKNKKHTS